MGFPFNNENVVLDKMIDLEIGNGIITPKINILNSRDDQNIKTKIKTTLTYAYNFIIFSIISWSILYAIVMAFYTKNIKYVGGYIFQVIFSSQYVLSIIYFKSNHLSKLLAENKKTEQLLNKRSIIAIIVTIFVSLLSTMLVVKGIDLTDYSVNNLIHKMNSPPLTILYFVTTFFGYLTFLINICIFSLVMHDHKQDVVNYTSRLKDYMSSSVTISEKVSRTSIEILELQERFNDSIDKLNALFSTMSVLGILHVFFTIEFWLSGTVVSTDVINLVMFFIIEYFYINSAQTLRTSINNISSEIKLPIHMGNLLQINNINRKLPSLEEFDNRKMYESIICTQIYTVQIIEYQSLQQLQSIINEPWACFEIFGLQISDTTIIQKMLGFLITIFISGSLYNALGFQI